MDPQTFRELMEEPLRRVLNAEHEIKAIHDPYSGHESTYYGPKCQEILDQLDQLKTMLYEHRLPNHLQDSTEG